MKNIKCASCGASIQPNENSNTGVCPYCDSAWVLDSSEQTNNQPENRKNNQTPKTIPLRPKFNLTLFIILLFISFWPAIIYYIITTNKQKEWDKQFKI